MEKRENQAVGRGEINQNFAQPKETQNGALTPPFSPPVFPTLPHTLPGSSVAEQVTVNHLVAGSIPARAAIEAQRLTHRWASPFKFVCPLTVRSFES